MKDAIFLSFMIKTFYKYIILLRKVKIPRVTLKIALAILLILALSIPLQHSPAFAKGDDDDRGGGHGRGHSDDSEGGRGHDRDDDAVISTINPSSFETNIAQPPVINPEPQIFQQGLPPDVTSSAGDISSEATASGLSGESAPGGHDANHGIADHGPGHERGPDQDRPPDDDDIAEFLGPQQTGPVDHGLPEGLTREAHDIAHPERRLVEKDDGESDLNTLSFQNTTFDSENLSLALSDLSDPSLIGVDLAPLPDTTSVNEPLTLNVSPTETATSPLTVNTGTSPATESEPSTLTREVQTTPLSLTEPLSKVEDQLPEPEEALRKLIETIRTYSPEVTKHDFFKYLTEYAYTDRVRTSIGALGASSETLPFAIDPKVLRRGTPPDSGQNLRLRPGHRTSDSKGGNS